MNLYYFLALFLEAMDGFHPSNVCPVGENDSITVQGQSWKCLCVYSKGQGIPCDLSAMEC